MIGVFCLWDMNAGRMAGGILRHLDPFLRSQYKKHLPKFILLNPQGLSFEYYLVVQSDKYNSD